MFANEFNVNRHRSFSTNATAGSCKGLQLSQRIHSDGEYSLTVRGRKVLIYCHNMNTSSPQEFITLSGEQSTKIFDHFRFELNWIFFWKVSTKTIRTTMNADRATKINACATNMISWKIHRFHRGKRFSQKFASICTHCKWWSMIIHLVEQVVAGRNHSQRPVIAFHRLNSVRAVSFRSILKKQNFA